MRATLIALFACIALALTGFASVARGEQPENPGNDHQGEMVTICHAAGLAGTTHFNTLTIAWIAVFGPGGHFNENGTTQAGHEQDYLGPCTTEDEPGTVEVCQDGEIVTAPEGTVDDGTCEPDNPPVDEPPIDEPPVDDGNTPTPNTAPPTVVPETVPVENTVELPETL